MKTLKTGLGATAMVAVLTLAGMGPLSAQDTVLATVNGQPITELDVQLAETEIGRDLGRLPEKSRRLVLVEFLIENYLFAAEAEKEKLDSGAAFDERMRYMRRRALRETYFEEKLKKSVSEAAAKTIYDDQVKGMKPEDEVKARHILVATQEAAMDLKERIARGADFAEVAKEHSNDPGSKSNGGMLGYFARGQMVPAFEIAAFELEKGEVSEPVQSRFGWHLIKVEDRRKKPVPTFEEVKQEILNSLVHKKTQSEAERLRKTATIDYVDPQIKADVEARNKKLEAQRSQQQLQFERRVREMQKENAQDKKQ